MNLQKNKLLLIGICVFVYSGFNIWSNLNPKLNQPVEAPKEIETKTVQKKEKSKEGLQEQMKRLAENAIESALEEYSISLDYSQNSLKDIDQILIQLHKANKKEEMKTSYIREQYLKWGAYVGEVVKKEKLYKWAADSTNFPDPRGIPILIATDKENTEMYVIDWCLNRFVNGEEDSIVSKYKVAIEE